jgi:UDP-galactopyranose mutase
VTAGPGPDVSGGARPAILCLAHLRWNWVWQRPQHVLTRAALRYPVLYVNEPVVTRRGAEARVRTIAESGELVALQPYISGADVGTERLRAAYAALIRDLLLERGWLRRDRGALVTTRPLIGWFYTPMPTNVVDEVPLDLVVYDNMDELADFTNAPPELRRQEERLLARADVVFAGSPSLYDLKKGRHRDVHLFASGVEAADFASASGTAADVPVDVRDARRPIIGYFGVLDERLDTRLLDGVAAMRPDWTWLMIGPVATKIRRDSLPRRENIRYLGMKRYHELPSYLAAFDVAIMPFAMNAATRYLRPTKTLEYMAAHKPVVSSPLADVVRFYSSVVRVGRTPEEFVDQIEAALGETPRERAERVRREELLLASSSWERIVSDMLAIVGDRLARRLRARPAVGR